jgi:hypothetical protein
MSGGYFGYRSYHLDDVIYGIERLIQHNDSDELDDDGYRIGRNYPPDIIKEFEDTLGLLITCKDKIKAIDYLVSDDIGEESFMEWIKPNAKD